MNKIPITSKCYYSILVYKHLIVLFFLAFNLSAYAQNTIGLPQIDNFSSNDFHGGSQTWDIKQDKQGRMYFANNEGLITYDGNHWKIYAQPNKTILRSIAIVDDKIFAGGQDEIGYFSPNAKGMLQYTSLKNLLPKNHNKFTDVWEIEVYKESVFFRTWEQIFEYKNETIKAYPASIGWLYLKLAAGKLYAQDKQKGLFVFKNNIWQPLAKQNANYNFEITGLIPLQNDSLLIGTLQNGLLLLHDSAFSKKTTSVDNNLVKSHIYSFEQINNKEYVIGTTSEGCIIINDKGQKVQQIAQSEHLQNNNVLSTYVDNNQNLWLGLDNGISFIAYNSAIKFIKPNSINDLSGYSSRVFHNQLYIATSDGAYVSNLTNNNPDLSFSIGNFSSIKNTTGQNWRFDEVNQQLLLGHHNGAYIIKNNEAIPISSDAGAWLFLPTASVYPSQKVIVGTYAGLTMLDYNNNDFKAHTLSGIFESLRFLTIDNNNDIWASHPYRGIYKISIPADEKTFSNILFTERAGLPSTFRNNVFKIKNRIVFATEKGIYEYERATNKFIKSPLLFDVFGSIPIQYLTEDEVGNIWFCTGKKIAVARFNKTNNSYKINYFPELTGKILSGFENIYTYNNENVFVASKNGILHINYNKYLEKNTTLKVLLSQVRTFGKVDSTIFDGYFIGTTDTTYSQNKNGILQFPISNNSFHFEFSATAYNLKDNIEYSYQLEGYENNWQAWTSKTEKDYTNLPSGTYTFKIKAHDNLGNESETINYRFIIKTAWYKTFIAYIFYLLVFLFSIYFILKWQKKKFHIQRLIHEEEQKKLKYIHQLEMEKNEKEILELQNEKLVNEVIYKNKELVDVSMHLVERSDALVKVKDELQQLYKKTGGNHDVKKAIQMVIDIEKTNSNWEQFASHFDEVNNDFLKKLKTKFPHLTNKDLKVCAYLQLNLASKEIAQLMNITVRGVELNRYRLRKKLDIPTEVNLFDFLNNISKVD